MTHENKLLVIGLDGYEASIGDKLMSEGRMPHLSRLKSSSSRFLLDHGKQKYSGLSWEHFATGLAPEISGRWSAVEFNPATYQVVQRSTTLAPLLGRVSTKTVVFDAPYFELRKAPQISGLVNWGAHDPGVATLSHPRDLLTETIAKFGPYPAKEHIYAFTWPSAARTRAAGEALAAALDQRTQISRWLFCERFPDWQLALVVVSELHSVIEPMWHGWDPAHPLHEHESAAPSRRGIEQVYEALDRLVGTLVNSLPDVNVVAFSMHGMGANVADVPAMLLLPELLYRRQFGRSLYEPRPQWRNLDRLPLLDETDDWHYTIKCCFNAPPPTEYGWLRSMARRLSARGMPQKPPEMAADPGDNERLDLLLDWMPAALYQPYWSKMRAFALPAFYDGRIRINLRGREHRGVVRLRKYDKVCRELEELLRTCYDPRTGASAVATVERCTPDDPLVLSNSHADLAIVWQGAPVALMHKDFGLIGPAPFRRTGGHTGGLGVCYIRCPSEAVGDRGVQSSFDMAPTILHLLGQPIPANISGRSLLHETVNRE
jgi:predicted AlkP superfamily phosphohydrolase/phosphomutase